MIPQGLFTIPAGVPFAAALAESLLGLSADDPLALADVTVLLPSRRARRDLEAAMMAARGGKATILPRMRPLGDVDEGDVAAVDPSLAADVVRLPPAMPDARRLLLLARLVRAREPSTQLAQAIALARSLADLLDACAMAGVDLDRLDSLVDDDLAQHWGEVLTFLTIIREHWPRLLDEEGAMDPGSRRAALMRAQVALWQAEPPRHPIIAAGSTGSQPMTAGLLAALAALPNGTVILPGLDRAMDLEMAKILEPSHPQASMMALLGRLTRAPGDVPVWPGVDETPAQAARAGLWAKVMTPLSAETGFAKADVSTVQEGLVGLRVVPCAHPREEATVIALALREALETPGQRAALVTTDRGLARRVRLRLRRCGVAVDDSAGEPLRRSLPFTLLDVLLDAVIQGLAPVPLMALLYHPLVHVGMAPGQARGAARQLDVALRGLRPLPGFAGLRARVNEQRARDDQTVYQLLDRLEAALHPLMALLDHEEHALDILMPPLVAVAEALAATPEMPGAEALWDGEAGRLMRDAVADLLEHGAALGPVSPESLRRVLEAVAGSLPVRQAYGTHPRLSILGPLEARLTYVDLMVVGGLNEGTWPRAGAPDPWLNRAMRAKLGLPDPETLTGLAAHDLVRAGSAPKVLLTRAKTDGGAPQVSSRWWVRLEAVAEAAGLGLPGAPELRAWAAAWDRPDAPQPVARPAPCPPLALRPRRLSVTAIETWMRDPYAIYARYILGLRPLDPLDQPADHRLFGIVAHKMMQRYAQDYPVTPPLDIVAVLTKHAEDLLAKETLPDAVRAAWRDVFTRIIGWAADHEAHWRRAVASVYAEIKGAVTLSGPAGPFELHGQADRIDRLDDGSLAIIDHKTGTPPSNKEVLAGFAPQLPLEAFMAQQGGFPDLGGAALVSSLVYWKLGGGRHGGKEHVIKAGKNVPLATLIDDTTALLAALVARFDDPATAYLCRPVAGAAPKRSDYGHLARVAAWSVAEGEGDT